MLNRLARHSNITLIAGPKQEEKTTFSQYILDSSTIFVYFLDASQTLDEQAETLNRYQTHRQSAFQDASFILLISKNDKLSPSDIEEVQKKLHISDEHTIRSHIENSDLISNLDKMIQAMLEKKKQRENEKENLIEILPIVDSIPDEKEVDKCLPLYYEFKTAELKLVTPPPPSLRPLEEKSSSVLSNSLTKASGLAFQALLVETKKTILADFYHDEISEKSALEIAAAANTLTEKVAACNITPNDLETFVTTQAVQNHIKKSTRFGRIIGSMAGAVGGIIIGALVGAMLGAGTGPGVIGTVALGALIGGISGVALCGYSGSCFTLWKNPLSGLHREARQVSEIMEKTQVNRHTR